MGFSTSLCSQTRILTFATATLFFVTLLFVFSDSGYLSQQAIAFSGLNIKHNFLVSLKRNNETWESDAKNEIIETFDTNKNILLFIGGPHYSGTSILRLLVGERYEFSIMKNTHRAEDEGQHVQTVYPRARKYGGPCRYASRSSSVAHMHMTKKDYHPSQLKIFEEWKPYWNLSKSVLVEKTPPNIIKSTWLQALADAKELDVHFVFMLRHPFTITQKNCPDKWYEYTKGWFTIMEILEREIVNLKHAYVIRYEDWMTTESHVYEVLDRMEKLVLPLRMNVNDNTASEENSTASRNRQLFSRRHREKNYKRMRRLKFRGDRGADRVKIKIKPVEWKRIDNIQAFRENFETKLRRYGYNMNNSKVSSELPTNLKSRLISTTKE